MTPSNDNSPVSDFLTYRREYGHVPFGEAAFMMLVAALVCALLAGGGW